MRFELKALQRDLGGTTAGSSAGAIAVRDVVLTVITGMPPMDALVSIVACWNRISMSLKIFGVP